MRMKAQDFEEALGRGKIFLVSMNVWRTLLRSENQYFRKSAKDVILVEN